MSHPAESTSEDFTRTLATVCEVAVKFGRAEHSGIVVFDPDHKHGTVKAEFPLEVGALNTIIPLVGAAEQDLVNTAKPIVIKDVEQNDELGPVKDILLDLEIRSLLVVPVVIDGEVKGSFSFDWLSGPQQFDPAEIDRCRSLAEVVALIFKNASLLDETQDQAEKLEALREAMLAITREDQREPLLKTILEQAVKLLKVTHGGIYEFNHHRKVLEVIADYNRPKRVGLTLELGEGMAGRLFMSADEFMTTPNYHSWEGRATSLGADTPFGSVLEVPLLWQNKRTGILYVDDVPNRVFREDEARLLQRFAATSSIALEHSRVRESNSYKLQRLESLASATNAIVSRIKNANVDERLTEIARFAHEILNAEACGIHQVREPGYLTLVASDGHREGGFPRNKKFKITSGHGTGLTGHIAYVGETFNKCGKDLAEHFAVANREPDTSRTGLCHSLLAVPLKKRSSEGESVTGLLRISNKKNTAGESLPWVCFSKADEYVAEIFAQAATVVLETTELVDEIRRAKDRYEYLLNTSNTIVKARTLESGLSQLAALLVRILNKSFCRIFLINEAQKSLYIMAAEQHQTGGHSFLWDPKVGEMAPLEEWSGLEEQLKRGKPRILEYQKHQHRDNLGRLSRKLNIRNSEGVPRTVQSMYALPLKIGHRTVGLINIGELRLRSDRRGEFSDDELDLANAMATQAKVIIDRTRHELELAKLRRRNDALLRSIERLRRTDGVDDLLRVIVSQSAAIFSNVAGMIIETPARRTLMLIDSRGKSTYLATSSLDDLSGLLGRTSRQEGSAIEYDFKKATKEEAFLLEYGFNIVLVTYITFASSRCLLFVGDNQSWSELGRGDLEILKLFGHQGRISLTKAAAQEQINKAQRGAYLIAEAMALNTIDVVLKKAVEGIQQSMDCNIVTLYVLDPRTGNFTFPPELAGIDDKLAAQQLLWAEKDSVMERIHGINEYHKADDTLNDPRMDGEFVRREGIVSSAAIPIFSDYGKIGVLFVNYRRPHHFDDTDQKNMEFLAHQAAVAIRNLREFNTLKRQETSLRALYETEQLIAAFTDLTDTLQKIAEQVWIVANSNNRKANVVSINRIENYQARVVAAYPENEKQHIEEVLNGEVDLVPDPRGDKRIGLVGVAFNERLAAVNNGPSPPGARTRVFRNLKNNPDYIALHDDTQCELVALIEDENSTILGAIAVENSEEDAFDSQDLKVIETLASQAGEAIRKDRQTRALQESTRHNARLQAVSLTGLSLSIARHEIHNLCLTISQNAQTCLESAGGIKRSLHKEELETISRCAKQLIQKPNTAPLDFETGRRHERVNKLIHNHLKNLRENRNYNVEFRDELIKTPSTKVWINQDWFNKVLGLFTKNSLKAMATSSSRVLTLKTSVTDDGHCLIEIVDTGPGMDSDVWEKLFEDRIINPNSRGQGVGLLVARTIVEVHGGTICKIGNNEGGVTTLGFCLPISFDSDDETHTK